MTASIYVGNLIPSNVNEGDTLKIPNYNWGVRYARAICRHFDWQQIPWKEPGENKEVFYRSAGYGRFKRFLHKIREGMSHAINTKTLEPFPHLLNLSIDDSVYIPVDFPRPFLVKAPDWDELTDSPITDLFPIKYHKKMINGKETPLNFLNWSNFVVGSSVQLAIELHNLQDFCNSLAGQSSGDDDVYTMYNIFVNAVQESLEWNLPLFVNY